ncbi:MAG: hypothetical protein ACLP1X_25025 [Polyangiaceae bacterium]
MMIQTQFVVVRDATDVVLRHLESLPSSARTGLLQAWVHDCLKEAEQWSASPPTRRELDRLMKRLLALHVEVTKLERERGVA